MKFLGNLLLAALCLGVGVDSYAAAQYKWIMAYLPVTGTTYYDNVQTLPERISKATNGRVQITANGSLVAGNRLLEAIRDGEVQMSMPLTGYYTGTQPLFTLGALPGISESLEDMQTLLASEYGEAVNAVLMNDYDARTLLTSAFCPQTLFSVRPVREIKDWKNLKLRVNNAATANLAKVLGAKPTSLSASEVLPALQRGIIEAVLTDSCWAYGAGLYTAVDYASDWQLGSIAPWSLVVSNKAWSSLPEDLQLAIKSELDIIEQELYASWAAKVEATNHLWKAKGITFHTVSDVEQRKVYSDQYRLPVFNAWHKQAEELGVDSKHWERVANDALKK